MEVKNKAILSLNSIACIAMWSLVTYSNLFRNILPTDAGTIKLQLHPTTSRISFLLTETEAEPSK